MEQRSPFVFRDVSPSRETRQQGRQQEVASEQRVAQEAVNIPPPPISIPPSSPSSSQNQPEVGEIQPEDTTQVTSTEETTTQATSTELTSEESSSVGAPTEPSLAVTPRRRDIHPLLGIQYRNWGVTTSLEVKSSIKDIANPTLMFRFDNDTTPLKNGVGSYIGFETSNCPVNPYYQVGVTGVKSPKVYSRAGVYLPPVAVPGFDKEDLSLSIRAGSTHADVKRASDLLPGFGLFKDKDNDVWLDAGIKLHEPVDDDIEATQSLVYSVYRPKRKTLTSIKKSLTEINDDFESANDNLESGNLVDSAIAKKPGQPEIFRGVEPRSNALSPISISKSTPSWFAFVCGAFFGGLFVYSYLSGYGKILKQKRPDDNIDS